jgi:hypothetical protein
VSLVIGQVPLDSSLDVLKDSNANRRSGLIQLAFIFRPDGDRCATQGAASLGCNDKSNSAVDDRGTSEGKKSLKIGRRFDPLKRRLRTQAGLQYARAPTDAEPIFTDLGDVELSSLSSPLGPNADVSAPSGPASADAVRAETKLNWVEIKIDHAKRIL